MYEIQDVLLSVLLSCCHQIRIPEASYVVFVNKYNISNENVVFTTDTK